MWLIRCFHAHEMQRLINHEERPARTQCRPLFTEDEAHLITMAYLPRLDRRTKEQSIVPLV